MPRLKRGLREAKRPNAHDWSAEEKAAWCNALCEWVTEGGSIASFAREFPDSPARSVWYDWFANDAIIADRYARARVASADKLAEDIIDIADSVRDAGHMDSARVNAARLAVDARKWAASKLKPQEYADRIETVASGSLTVQHKITDDEAATVLARLMARQAIQTAPNLIEAQRMIEAQAKDVTPKETADDCRPAAQPGPHR